MLRWSRIVSMSGILLLLGATASWAGPPGGAPRGEFQIRFGGFFPEGGGDLWESNEAFFTLDASDFDGFVLGFTTVFGISNHVEFGANLDFYDASERSAYRDPVPGFPNVIPEDPFTGAPIRHDTRLEMVPLTFDLRFLPAGRFKIRGPDRRVVLQPVFYIGAGIGLNFWEYKEVGDFLDLTQSPPIIFFDSFYDDGVAFESHVLAGLEFPVGRRSNFLLEGRYSWSDDKLGGDFDGLGTLEMDGPSFFGGFGLRF